MYKGAAKFLYKIMTNRCPPMKLIKQPRLLGALSKFSMMRRPALEITTRGLIYTSMHESCNSRFPEEIEFQNVQELTQ